LFFFEKSDIHRPYGGAKRSGTSKKRHPLPEWRHQIAQDQEKATSIALMETQKGAGSAKSVINITYGDTKRSGTSKKRHPLPLWRHLKAQDQKNASSTALMEAQKGAGTRKKRPPSPVWGREKKPCPQILSAINAKK
jgi:hypothetical protein